MSSPAGTVPNLHVLLIGVDYYRPGAVGGVSYPNLRGSVRDIALVEDFVRLRLEVPPNRLRKLTSSAPGVGQSGPPESAADLPTYRNMVSAFQRITTDAAKGDLVYIHYCGHGGRTATRWPDLKPDGLDESLVPYDISDPNAQYLRDLELSHLLRSMTLKGLYVTLVLDSCHSGGATRLGVTGPDVAVRGVDFSDSRPRPAASLVASDAELAANWREQKTKAATSATRGLAADVGWVPATTDYVLLAACREHESAYEFRFEGEHRNGALTYWLMDALRGLRPGLSYQAVYDRLLAKVHTQFDQQTPLLLGPAERAVFGTDTIPIRPASIVMKVDGRRVLLQTGQAVGVRNGARFALYPRGAVGGAPAALADVVEIGAAQSWATIVEGHDRAGITEGDAAILLSSATLRRKVRLGTGPRFDAVRRALPRAGEGWIEEAGPNDRAEFHVFLDATDRLVIGDAAAQPLPHLAPLAANELEAEYVVRRLEHIARYRAVEEIDNHDEESPLAGKLVVELLGKQANYTKGDPPNPEPFPDGGLPELRPGESVFVRIRNTSRFPLNVAVLNLEPGWGVSLALPRPGADRSFETIEPGKERLWIPRASLPDGTDEGLDELKVFAAIGAADFRSLALPVLRDVERGATRSSRSEEAVAASRGGKPPGILDRLFARLTEDRPTRALTLDAAPSEEWTVTSVSFRTRRAGAVPARPAQPISKGPTVTTPQTAPPFFADVNVLGARPPEEVAAALRAMGDPDADRAVPAARAADDTGARGGLFGWGKPRAWEHTAHQLGFIAPGPVGSMEPLPIIHPGVIAADPSLKDARINIHLDRLRVEDYPGGGDHLVMVTFRAQNQLSAGGESVSFGQAYRVRAGQTAGVTGYPLCIGFGVGKTGAAFQFFTVNVKDSADESMLAVLESPAFTGGLNLLTIAQPAIKPLTDLTLGIAKKFATRNRNRPVQDCYLGLDFTPAAFGARLAIGNYIAVQVPAEGTIRWNEWEFQPGDGLIVNKADKQTLGYNYLVFRVSKYEE